MSRPRGKNGEGDGTEPELYAGSARRKWGAPVYRARTPPLHASFERLWYHGRGAPPYLFELLLAPLLLFLSIGFRFAVALRRAAYRLGLLGAHRLDVPVISVGSLVVGGVGKTQVVIAVAELLLQIGRRPAVVLRGYKGCASRQGAVVSEGRGGTEPLLTSREAGDEAVEIATRLPNIAVCIGVDRVRAARRAVETLGADIIVLDDGFQHVRLARDLDILVWDAGVKTRSFRLLPYGPFREPLSALARADLVMTIGQDPATRPTTPGTSRIPPLVAFTRLVDFRRLNRELAPAPTGPVVLFTTIASPERVASTLRAAGIEIAAHVSLPDHAHPSPDDLARLPKGTVVVTEKDAVKIPADWSRTGEVLVARAHLSFLGSSGATLRQKLLAACHVKDEGRAAT